MALFTSIARTDLGLSLQDAALYIALDTSGSMTYVASNGQTRLANLQTAVVAFLTTLQSTGASNLDIRMVSWAGSIRTSIERRDADSADYDALIAWTEGLVVGVWDGSDFDVAVGSAPAFFAGSGDKERLLLFVTDGEALPVESAAAAAATLAGISDLTAYAINIEETNTQYTELLDNTASDDVPVVSGGNPAALQSVIQTAIFETIEIAVPAVTLTLSRSYAPGYPAQTMAADGSVHEQIGSGTIAAATVPGAKRGWSLRFEKLALADYTNFESFFHDTTARFTHPFDWPRLPAGETVRVRFDPSAPPVWTPVANTMGKWNLEFGLVEA